MLKAVGMGAGRAEEVDKRGLSEGLRPCFVKAAFIALPGSCRSSQPEATVQGRKAWTPDSQIPLTPTPYPYLQGLFLRCQQQQISHECSRELCQSKGPGFGRVAWLSLDSLSFVFLFCQMGSFLLPPVLPKLSTINLRG